jgi:membrane protein involved in colicin uptake
VTKHDLAVKAAAKASEKAETERVAAEKAAKIKAETEAKAAAEKAEADRVAAEKANTEKPVADNPINNP